MPLKQLLARPLAGLVSPRLPARLAVLLKAMRLGIGLSVLSLGLGAGAAQAGVVRFNFALDFAAGPLGGQSAFGSFDVDGADCAALVCSGTFTPSGPGNPIVGPTGTLLAFSVVIDGVRFDIGSDDGFPDFPSVELQDSVLTRLDFMDFGGPPSLTIFGSLLGGWGGEYRDAFFDASQIGDVRQIGGAQAVAIPEPATLLLVSGALLAGIPLTRRRRA